MKPEIKKRIEQIQKGVVPEGYKKTKVGIVPDAWDERSFDSLFTFNGGLSISRDKLTYEGINYLHYGDIHTREKNYMDIAVEENTMPKIPFDSSILGCVALEDGDIVFADASEDYEGIGKSVVVYNQEQRPAIAGLHTIVAKGKTNDLFRDYKRFCMQTKYIRKQFVFYATGVSVFGVTKNSIGKIIAVLPLLPEQEKIAEILSTWDKAIELKEQLIVEKKQQKKWLMQNLLTGKKRLSGFGGKWQVVRLGEIATCYSGGTPDRGNLGYYEKGIIPWIKSGELNSKQIYETEEHISEAGLNKSAAKIIYPGDILLALYGATAGVVAVSQIKAAINQAILAIRPNNQCLNTYLFYCLDYMMINVIEKYTQGGQPNLNSNIVKKLIVNLPSLPEQTAIAEILSTADREIDLHEKQFDELKKQKKALMQLLLTGIVRVNVQEVS